MSAPAEIRAPRRRRWLRGLAWGAAATLALLLTLLAWLLYSASGLAWLLQRGLGAAGGSIEYGALRGSLSDGFELDTPRIEVPGLRIDAATLQLRLRASALLHGEVLVESLRLSGARYTVLPTDAAPQAQASARPGRVDLPIDLVLRNIELVANELDLGGEQPLVFSIGSTEITLRHGQLHVDGLAVRLGDFAVRASAAVDTGTQWSGNLDSEGVWTLPSVLHRGRLRLAGDLDALDMELALEGGGELSFNANLARPLEAPGVQGKLGAVRLDLASFGLDAPVRLLDLDLSFAWADGKLGISGPVTLDERKLELVVAGLELVPQQLRFERIEVKSDEVGSVVLSGQWPTAAAAPPGAVRAELSHLWLGDWRGAMPAAVPRVDGVLEFSGRVDDWQARLDGEWSHPLPAPLPVADPAKAATPAGAAVAAAAAAPPQVITAVTTQGPADMRGPLQLVASGTPERIVIAPSRVGLADSLVEFAGEVGLADSTTVGLDLTLTAVDPGLLVLEWPGRLDGQLRVDASLGAQTDWKVAVASLSGALRDAPLTLTGQLEGRDAQLRAGQMDLHWGAGGAVIAVTSADAVSAELDHFDLALVGPWQGRVSGHVDTHLGAEVIASTLAELSIDDLSAAGVVSRQLRLSKRAGWSLTVASEEMDLDGTLLQQSLLTVEGSAAQHRIDFGTREARGQFDLTLAGSWLDAVWSGTLERLELHPAKGAAWSLADTAALRLDNVGLSLAPACLQAATARACIGIERSAGLMTIPIELTALPLQELQAWAPESDWQVSGQLSGGGTLTLDSNFKAGGALAFAIESGVLRGTGDLEQPLAFDGTLRFAGADGDLAATINLPGHGTIEAHAVHFDQPDAAIDARVALTDLSFVDGLNAEVQGMRGALDGELHVPLATPTQLHGRLEASQLIFELPAVGLKIGDGTVALLFEGDGMLRVDAGLGIAPGHLRIEGLVGLGDSDVAEVRVRGDNAGLVDLPAVRLAGDTNFLIKRTAEGYAIEGGILLRDGKINLDRFQPAFPPSEDVVIEDAPPAPAPLPISADISVAMIQAVDLRGFGIEATLNGGVRITQRPGKRPRGQGEMLIKGIYNAYGQKLDIERGRVGFAGRADNPSLDILAVKRVDRQRVGVQVRGNAKRPAIRLYSDPSLDQSETLSYLVLGRPLATASGADSAQLGEYASALETAGGSLVAGSIGKKLGLAAGVESFGSAIGSALVVGKYISPRFFIGYGTSLLDATQLVILRFRITESFEFEGISGAEQKGSVSWRTER